MKNFAIGIPTLNRFDLLLPALIFYCKFDFPDTPLLLVDNGQQNIINNGIQHIIKNKSVFIFQQTKNIGVAGSWNLLLSSIFADSYIKFALILNDDIYLGLDEAYIETIIPQKLVANHICEFNNYLDQAFIMLPENQHYNWSYFIISRKAWDIIGHFDENFYPAYYEDTDYERRAKLKNVPVLRCLKAPARYVNSGTGQADPSVFANSKKNLEYYTQKWGGAPGHETIELF